MNKANFLVGILSGSHKQKRFSGDEPFFQNIQSELAKQNGLSYVFTPDAVGPQTINGYVFENSEWKKKTFPYPEVVYNRLPSRKAENSQKMQTFFETLNQEQIPYFNPRFFNKWETYETLIACPHLKISLPHSELLTDTEKAFAFLKKHAFIYIKPIGGKTGKGILSLISQNENDFKVTTQTRSKNLSANGVYRLFSTLLQQSLNAHLLQQGIHLNQWNGQKYDFRVLLLKPQHEWKVIGIGVRAAAQHKITTHTLRGGAILPFEEIRPKANVDALTSAAKQVAEALSKTYPLLRECSLDIGRDENGGFWLFEMNTKPMAFDEEHIENQRVIELCKTFRHLAHLRLAGIS